MKKIENMLNNELVELEKVLISACKRYEERDNLMEDSYLRIAHKKNRVDYYLKDKTGSIKNCLGIGTGEDTEGNSCREVCLDKACDHIN